MSATNALLIRVNVTTAVAAVFALCAAAPAQASFEEALKPVSGRTSKVPASELYRTTVCSGTGLRAKLTCWRSATDRVCQIAAFWTERTFSCRCEALHSERRVPRQSWQLAQHCSLGGITMEHHPNSLVSQKAWPVTPRTPLRRRKTQ